jgi:lipoprotein NlpI
LDLVFAKPSLSTKGVFVVVLDQVLIPNQMAQALLLEETAVLGLERGFQTATLSLVVVMRVDFVVAVMCPRSEEVRCVSYLVKS